MPKTPSKVFDDPASLEGLLLPHAPTPLWNPALDPVSYDELLQNRGLRWLHYKAAFCPNVNDLEIQQHPPTCRDCDNGYLFFQTNDGQPIYGAYYNNKLERIQEINGLYEAGNAVVTFTSYNRSGPNGQGPAGSGSINDFKVGDKLVCLDFVFSWAERLEHSPSGVDRLKYPAKEVEFLADRDRRYMFGTDFDITPEGWIKWLGVNRPKVDQIRGRGGIFTIVYTANPVFFVTQLLHEIRATKGVDRDGVLRAIRLPQQVMIQRDYFFKDPNNQNNNGSGKAPRNGTLQTPE